MAERMDWLDLGRTIFGAGVGTAIAQGILALVRDRGHQNRQAAYMAMRLAIILEAYTNACAEVVATNENAETPPGEEKPYWDTRLPDLPPYPDDAEGWRALDRELAGKCLGFRNKLVGSQAMIGSAIDYHNTPDEIAEEVAIQASERGLEAWEIATWLRSMHDVEAVETVWDFDDTLRRALKQATAERAERKARQAKHWAAHRAAPPPTPEV